MSDPNDLSAYLAEAWRHITRGVADSRHPARYPTFATVSPNGKPELRTVALRKADREAGVLEVHTDTVTPKVKSLRQTPYASIHIWVPRADMQLRLNAEVEIITGPETEAIWARVPQASRVSYGTTPDPGVPISSVYAYEKPPRPDRFAILRCLLTDMDIVHLGERHRRAEFARRDGWVGTWLSP